MKIKICTNLFNSKKVLITLVNHNAELCVDSKAKEAWVYFKERERYIPYDMAYEMSFMIFHNSRIFELDSGNFETGMEYYRFNNDVIRIANEYSYMHHLKKTLQNLIIKYDSANLNVTKADILWLSKKRR